MTLLPFWKLQSIGNDFPLVHVSDVRSQLGSAAGPGETELLGKLALAICDRRFGVGGDGLLTVEIEDAAVRLRMFNPDGTEDFCGNGIRCAAVHVHAQGWVSSEFVIRHLDREIPVSISDGLVRTVIGVADYNPERVPHTYFGEIFNANVWSGMDADTPMTLFGSALTTGSTHVVIPTHSLPWDEGFASVSEKIEHDPRYPQRTSVIWTQEVGPNHLKLRIWERGVGETLGCGTGSSAAAADYMRRKGLGGTVTVESKGGTLKVSASRWDQPITIEGRAEIVFEGSYRFALVQPLV